ncbi:phosphoribosylformylglycinamidine cyclo-ligase [Hydrogenispora ethanolica]|uniref:Phosphoribosylformylglycinamidine cyclo-ligase n=1 Tax=Hydrogenispora ethanolica TaxID=1082276 RepID=A0A4R1QL40_HYDET|nr:phosphoribosylformylglycinamidine cyclo-ligase [Hydrogenispora ethanolica]
MSIIADLYKEAGVDIDAGNEAVRRIKTLVKGTHNRQVIGDLGSFGGLYSFPSEQYRNPVLVSSTDGVGTKLKIAFALERYDTVGYDLVNHCVNDILVQGAKPLFFLDYIGTGTVRPAMIEAVVSGLARGCRENGCVLIGGETAEMPGIYSSGEFDLVGTIVGVVERDELITGAAIQPGDRVLGLPSWGLHTNGYSLARKICFEDLGLQPTDRVAGLERPIGEELLASHRSYFQALYPLITQKICKGLAHLTGGGFIDNIPRILPEGCAVQIQKGSWPVLPIFRFLQESGGIPDAEAYRVFNMGIGMVAIVAQESLTAFQAAVPESYLIGAVIQGDREVFMEDPE